MASVIVKPYRQNQLIVHPAVGSGGGTRIDGVVFSVVDEHILNLTGNISVDENGIICL